MIVNQFKGRTMMMQVFHDELFPYKYFNSFHKYAWEFKKEERMNVEMLVSLFHGVLNERYPTSTLKCIKFLRAEKGWAEGYNSIVLLNKCEEESCMFKQLLQR